MASQLFQGVLAASVPCDDDAPGVLVPSVTAAPSGTPHETAAAHHCDTTARQLHQQHCRFCGSGACHMTHVPALAVAFTALAQTRLQTLDAPAPAVEPFDFKFDLILRPPK